MNYLIEQIDIGLTSEEQTWLSNRVKQGIAKQLSPEKEGGPFLFYLTGSDLKTVSQKSNIPYDVICLTAIHYNWPDKARNVRGLIESEDNGDYIKAIQKDLANTILIVTKLAMEKQLADVLSGKLKPNQCRLIPNNIHSLQKLMEILNTLNGVDEASIPKSGSIVTGKNVQINNYIQEKEKESKKDVEVIDKKKTEMLKIVDS